MIHPQNQRVRYQILPAQGRNYSYASVYIYTLHNKIFCMNSSDSTEYEMTSSDELFDEEPADDNDDFNSPNDDDAFMDVHSEL